MLAQIYKGASAFLQSKEWGSFQRSVGRTVWRLDGVLLIKHNLPLGLNYIYSPRPSPALLTDGFFSSVAKLAQVQRSTFLKIEPVSNFKFQISNFEISNAIQPTKTMVLDLDRSEEEMLAQMHEKTRYNIRLAERRGVEVKKISTVGGDKLQKFWELLNETATRDGFRTHEEEYYQKLLQVRSEGFSNELFFAEYGGEVLAAALVNFYRSPTSIASGVATYLHGASSRAHKDIMAPHLLHWRIMQEAKNRGFKYYDFWGIDEKRWPGLTRFKLGFGGNALEHPPALDIIYNQFYYWLYRAARRIT